MELAEPAGLAGVATLQGVLQASKESADNRVNQDVMLDCIVLELRGLSSV